MIILFLALIAGGFYYYCGRGSKPAPRPRNANRRTSVLQIEPDARLTACARPGSVSADSLL